MPQVKATSEGSCRSQRSEQQRRIRPNWDSERSLDHVDASSSKLLLDRRARPQYSDSRLEPGAVEPRGEVKDDLPGPGANEVRYRIENSNLRRTSMACT